MIESIKLVSFKDKYCLLKKMPVYINGTNIYLFAFMFLIIGSFGVFVYFYLGFKTSDEYAGAAKMIAFCYFVAFLSILFAIKGGDFVLAADENGIYYRVFGWKDNFMFIKWCIVNEISNSYFDGTDRVDVITRIKKYDMPMACNTEISESRVTKTINISFFMPIGIKSSEIKRKLNELRIKSLA